MKLKKNNATTAKNLAIPFSRLIKLAKQNNDLTIKMPKPNAIRGSNNLEKT